MTQDDLQQPITSLPRVGSKVAAKLKRLDIETIGDLVWHAPHRYEDFSAVKSIDELKKGEKATIIGRILAIETSRTWKKKMLVTEAIVEDKTGPLRVVWFNQPFLEETLKQDLWVSFSGKVSLGKKGLYLSNPIFETIGMERPKSEDLQDMTHTGGLVPIYPETRGLTSRWLRWRIKDVLTELEPIEDFLPSFIIEEYGLMELDTALRSVHFPTSKKEYERARARLSFSELFLVQLTAAREKAKIKKKKAPALPTNVDLVKKFVTDLPFTLTESQRISAWQMLKDIEKPHPMNRLLEGDVGSGKTVVAGIVALNVMDAGWQVALMAPTEILATQHFATLQEMFAGHHHNIALLTSSQVKHMGKEGLSKKELLEQVASGEVKMVVGTHALIQKEVSFKRLGLAIVDEQHRFGVKQRAKLLRENKQKAYPHLLSMTATPIPRTLALTLYGDLDISLLKEMPQGRKEIKTSVVPPSKREGAYEFIRDQIEKGRQAFVVCPLIDESEALEVKSVTEEHRKLSEDIFPDLSVAMLHGKLKPDEKKEVMQRFVDGKADILVSTSVVEVGIDVPNAAVMMVEGAERFGLAQLHQFRGRVGRGEHQSYCFLFTTSGAQATRKRLKALAETNDGFALAEKDLAIRGPGQFFGTQQSGLPDLAMEGLKDIQMIEKAQEAAHRFLEESSLKEHPKLQERFESFARDIHWE